VNRVQIVNIEAGRKTGLVATLRKLASTLQIEIDDLVSPSSAHDDGDLRN
jgi:mRNA interferase RelE/StbE